MIDPLARIEVALRQALADLATLRERLESYRITSEKSLGRAIPVEEGPLEFGLCLMADNKNLRAQVRQQKEAGLQMAVMKQYLGDGVYCDWDGERLVLTAEDGRAVTNVIYLDRTVYSALVDYVNLHIKKLSDAVG